MDKMTNSDSMNEVFNALSKAQAEIKPAKKDRDNTFFKTSYATLASIWEAVREPFSKNGLCVTQVVEGMELVTVLGHSSGQRLISRYPLKPMKEDMQSLGSAITYARRYGLMAIAGICPDDDDDGQAATTTHSNGQWTKPASFAKADPKAATGSGGGSWS